MTKGKLEKNILIIFPISACWHLLTLYELKRFSCFFLLELWEVESLLGPRGTAAMYWPIVPVPGDSEDGEVG
jgi:hypothetical protein